MKNWSCTVSADASGSFGQRARWHVCALAAVFFLRVTRERPEVRERWWKHRMYCARVEKRTAEQMCVFMLL